MCLSYFGERHGDGGELPENLECPVIIKNLPFSFPFVWAFKNQSVAAFGATSTQFAGIADACGKLVSLKWFQLKLGKQISSIKPHIKQKETHLCHEGPKYYCFVCSMSSRVSSKTGFTFSWALTFLGLEPESWARGQCEQKISSCTQILHRGMATETSLCAWLFLSFFFFLP